MKCKVIDLHCDLLSYLADNPERNDPLNPRSNCSLSQLREGGVMLQTLAVFALSEPGSTTKAASQIACYRKMLREHADLCAPFSEFDPDSEKVHFVLSVENASALVEEEEPLEIGFKNFDAQDWLYVSLTWNEENRFGGGNASQAGLKRGGELMLEYMDGKNTAIDLSHTSIALAHDILNHIHKKGLNLVPIASHSNFRVIKDHVRNLPDAIAKEVMAMGGVIGMNFLRMFVGEDPQDFVRHVQHGLSLGGEDHLCMGGDFFGGIPLPTLKHLRPFFLKEFENSSCYPSLFDRLSAALSPEQIEKLASNNAMAFIRRIKN